MQTDRATPLDTCLPPRLKFLRHAVSSKNSDERLRESLVSSVNQASCVQNNLADLERLLVECMSSPPREWED